MNEEEDMNPAAFFRMKGLTTVAGRTYPGTYSIASVGNFMAEQVANRDSASWKKAEHIVLSSSMPDVYERNMILERWKMLTAAEPVGMSIQKLYIPIAYDKYVKYDACGVCVKTGTMEEVWA